MIALSAPPRRRTEWPRGNPPSARQRELRAGSEGGVAADLGVEARKPVEHGVPYSANTVLTEYWDRISAPNGDEWLVVSNEVRDPEYLSSPFITSTHFKKEADGAKWSPSQCTSK